MKKISIRVFFSKDSYYTRATIHEDIVLELGIDERTKCIFYKNGNQLFLKAGVAIIPTNVPHVHSYVQKEKSTSNYYFDTTIGKFIIGDLYQRLSDAVGTHTFELKKTQLDFVWELIPVNRTVPKHKKDLPKEFQNRNLTKIESKEPSLNDFMKEQFFSKPENVLSGILYELGSKDPVEYSNKVINRLTQLGFEIVKSN